MALYEDFTPSVALRFSLFYRAAGRIRSTLEEYETTVDETATRQYGRTGLTYCTVVGCSGQEQSHMQKEAGRG